MDTELKNKRNHIEQLIHKKQRKERIEYLIGLLVFICFMGIGVWSIVQIFLLGTHK
jgi:uncharacterized membrane protein